MRMFPGKCAKILTFFSQIQFKIMTIKIQLADNVYKALLAGGNRIQGSIGLVSPTEGNFNAHRRSPSE